MSTPSTPPSEEQLGNLNFEFVRKQFDQPPAWSQDKLLTWDDAYPLESLPRSHSVFSVLPTAQAYRADNGPES